MLELVALRARPDEAVGRAFAVPFAFAGVPGREGTAGRGLGRRDPLGAPGPRPRPPRGRP